MAGFQIGQWVSGGAAAAPFVSQAVAPAPDRRRQVVAVVAANLLLTTLAVVAPPVVPQAQASAPRYVWQVQDTSAGMAQVLRDVLVVPLVANAPHNAPDRSKWQPSDTSRGVPKPLYADAQLPVQNAPHTAPDRLRPVVDTSVKQPITLQVIAVPAPVVNAPHLGPLRYPGLPADTSRGTAKPLYGDAVAPFLNVPQRAPDRIRPVTDTTRGQPITLQAIVLPPPPFTLPHQAPARYPYGLPDTSGCTPKPLYDDVVVPPVTPAVDQSAPAGSAKKRGRPPKRFVVEWNSRIYHVEGEREAIALLAQLRAQAEKHVPQQAKTLARRAVKQDSPPPLEAPTVAVSGDATIGAQRAAERAQAQLAAMYEREAERAYIAALEWHLDRLRDEHEALTLLVLDDD